MRFTTNKNITLQSVHLGNGSIKVPVAEFGTGDTTVLITGGMDGDEYAGIEAAYRLIAVLHEKKLLFHFIIIPVVNIPGFEKGVSWNPNDKKYPKYIYPGKKNGSSTEQLLFWLSKNYISRATLWIDLHSGASTEVLSPFVWTWQTKNKMVNTDVIRLSTNIKTYRLVYEKASDKKMEALAKKNTRYILFESGDLGKRDEKAIQQHIDWTLQLLEKKSPQKKEYIRQVFIHTATQKGIWQPTHRDVIKKGDVLGFVYSLDEKFIQEIKAKHDGVFLWRREAMQCVKNDELFAYGSRAENIS